MKYNISVEWSGSYPNLCRGKDTSGDYQSLHFDNNWSAHWNGYHDGSNQTEWIDSVRFFDINNLKQSFTDAGFDVNDDELMSELYF